MDIAFMVSVRVLINSTAVLPSPPPRYGGIELIVWLLARGLVELTDEPMEVVLAAPQGSTQPHPKVRLFTTVGYYERHGELIIAERVAPFLDEFKPDIIHDASHTKCLYQLAKQKNITYIPHAHNLTIPIFPEKEIRLVTLSKRHSQWIYEKFGVRSRYIYNGLDPSNYYSVSKKHRVDRFLYLARPNPEKGVIEAIAFCRKYNLPLDVICGRIPGDMTNYLLEVARLCFFRSPQVYHGEVSQEKKCDMLARAKALLFFPQVHEAFGLNIIEALLSGTPVIGNDMGALPEIVQHGKSGFIVPVKKEEDGSPVYEASMYGWYHVIMNEEDILKAIEQLPNLDRDEIRVKAQEQWSYKRMAQDFYRLYRDVLDKGEKW